MQHHSVTNSHPVVEHRSVTNSDLLTQYHSVTNSHPNHAVNNSHPVTHATTRHHHTDPSKTRFSIYPRKRRCSACWASSSAEGCSSSSRRWQPQRLTGMPPVWRCVRQAVSSGRACVGACVVVCGAVVPSQTQRDFFALDPFPPPGLLAARLY
jgi:hypothetical protein